MSDSKINRIAVLGLGGVGELAARLLTDSGFTVTGVDVSEPDATLPFKVATASATEPAALEPSPAQVSPLEELPKLLFGDLWDYAPAPESAEPYPIEGPD